jgi:MazG family protein
MDMSRHLEALLRTIRTLRAPGGCPWDRKQSLADAAGNLQEEAGELVDAAVVDDLDGVREELGDLLFMLCFCTEILSERTGVTLDEIARQGDAKLVRRHPHVFGDRKARNAGESQRRWNEIKAAEKRARGLDPDREAILKPLPSSTAPLRQAYRYQQNVAEVGFDWPDVTQVWDKVGEEMVELREAAAPSGTAVREERPRDTVEHEVGDLLFAVVNLARWLDVKPDLALRAANERFRSRFCEVEEHFGGSRARLAEASLAELEKAWSAAKEKERSADRSGAHRERETGRDS